MSQWQIIIPVKRFSVGKSRILHDRRAAFARAFALDTITAAARCGLVGRVVVVTDEPTLHPAAFDEVVAAKVAFLREAPTGLNPVITYAVARMAHTRPDERIGVLLGDLPALHPTDLGDALYDGTQHERAFVRDAEGTGTTLLMASTPSLLAPAFGTDSAARHEALGYRELRGQYGNLARDVDTTEDLVKLKGEVLAGSANGNTARLLSEALGMTRTTSVARHGVQCAADGVDAVA